MNIDILKNKIDELAPQNRPFLFALNFELTEGILIENPKEQDQVLFRTPLGSNVQENSAKPISTSDNFILPHPEPYEVYLKRFEKVMTALKRGDSFLANLTITTPIETNLSLRDIFYLSDAPYSLYVPDNFVCFSPERFVRIADEHILTNPMKGTINASIPNAEQIILNDKKETAEHHTIVDLLRNDLSMVASEVAVDRFRYIDRIKTKNREILQVSSEISGRLGENYLSEIGSTLFQMLPAGSISGAPKDSTIRAIQYAEERPRGYYTGIFGYFDGKELDSAVLIRYIEEHEGQKYFKSGGGITVLSQPEDEYKEVIEKIYLPFSL